ncbi:MAG: hypothetical protein ACN4GW_00675 [Desulforhopalus sp.]
MVKLKKNRKNKGLFSRLKQAVSRSDNDPGVVYQESEYPYITDEMITPLEKPLSTKGAISIYRKHMLAIGYLEKTELNEFVRSLKEEIGEQQEFLKDEVRAAKEALAEAKGEVGPEIKRIKKLRSKTKDLDEKADYSRDLEEVEAEIHAAQQDLVAAVEDLEWFRKDKRQFLINYINSEVHGANWSMEQDG